MTETPKPFDDSGRFRASLGLALLVSLAAVGFPRLMLLGGLPGTDEGIYAYYAQIIHAGIAAGRGLPDVGPLMFYPVLSHWVFAIGGNALVALRAWDLLWAVATGCALYRVLEWEGRSRVGAAFLSLLFLFTMNQPVFIQHGFKNSIHAALLPLLGALLLGMTAPFDEQRRGDRAHRWAAVGAALSVAVLLRETLLPLAALGAVTVLISRGPRAFGVLMAGAVFAAVLFGGILLVARGGLTGALEGYREAGRAYAAIADQRAALFWRSGLQAATEARVALVVAGLGCIISLVHGLRVRDRSALAKTAFWLAVAFLPLLEPASKIGYPYHFSVSLPGLAGLAAVGLRAVTEGGRALRHRMAYIALACAVASFVVPRVGPLWGNWRQTREVLAAFNTGAWPAHFTGQSNYLLAADAIREAVPTNGTVSVSGYMLALYPLTRRLPPSPELSNLTHTIVQLDLSAPRLRELLLRCPPDVVMTTTRSDWPGSAEILAAVEATGLYEELAEIPTRPDRAYGTFGGKVFRVTRQLPCGR